MGRVNMSRRRDLIKLIQMSVMSGGEICEYLNISRPRLNELVKAGRLEIIKEMGNQRLFLSDDVEEVKEQIERSPYKR